MIRCLTVGPGVFPNEPWVVFAQGQEPESGDRHSLGAASQGDWLAVKALIWVRRLAISAL